MHCWLCPTALSTSEAPASRPLLCPDCCTRLALFILDAPDERLRRVWLSGRPEGASASPLSEAIQLWPKPEPLPDDDVGAVAHADLALAFLELALAADALLAAGQALILAPRDPDRVRGQTASSLALQVLLSPRLLRPEGLETLRRLLGAA